MCNTLIGHDQTGKALGATHVLTGTVSPTAKSINRYRVELQLVEVVSGETLENIGADVNYISVDRGLQN